MKKKGIGLGEAFGAVLTLVLIAMLVIIAIYLFVSLQGTVPLVAASTYNETVAITTAGTTLSNQSLCRSASPSILYVYNGTILVPGSNYTFNSDTWKITNTTATAYNTAKVSYSYQWGSDTCVASQTVITQFGTYPALLGLVGTIIFLGIVIGVLVGSFIFNRRRGV